MADHGILSDIYGGIDTLIEDRDYEELEALYEHVTAVMENMKHKMECDHGPYVQ